MSPRYKLAFFVPSTHLTSVKSAIFSSVPSAGKIGNYSQCAFETVGWGQFLPTEGAKPVLGKVGEVERVEEWKVEIVCNGEEMTKEAVKTLKEAHPYEEVAYDVYRLEDF